MADQATGTVETGSAAGAAAVGRTLGAQHLEHNPGRAISWVGVAITIAGSVIGGWSFFPLGITPVAWWLFWAGAAVMAVGLLVLIGAKTISRDWY